MKKLFLCLLFSYTSSVFAQRIEGTVRDTEGNVLPFATLLIKNSTQGATANNQGQYSFLLSPGTYTLECRYVGYHSVEKTIILTQKDAMVNFVLERRELSLEEIVINPSGEDPAYRIIREAIKKRPEYLKQIDTFTAKVYIKGMVKMLDMPGRIFGKKISDEDKEDMMLDSAGKGILYLAESVTKVSVRPPRNTKLEVLSSRVSGSKGFGFDFPAFISFYQNNVPLFGSQLNPRGFISPIADNALHYYRYRLMGRFRENGKLVNSIMVIPRRQYEPLFTGVINITDGDWRIYSCKLYVTRNAQLEIMDTLQISQIHAPVEDDVWAVKNQVLHFHFDKLGIAAEGNFVNIYMDYNLHPEFAPHYFNKIIVKYDTAAQKKSRAYWENIRPVPLEPEEIKDYRVKDSMMVARDTTKPDLDSLRKRQGPIKLTQILVTDVHHKHYSEKHPFRFESKGLLKTLAYNTVEGVYLNPYIVTSFDSKSRNHTIKFMADVRYGFGNRHINPWAGLVFTKPKDRSQWSSLQKSELFIAGGKRVSQFFKTSIIDGLSNSVSTLLYGWNDMKVYENYFAKAGYKKRWESSAELLIQGSFEDRYPLENTTDFLLNDKWKIRLTPNYPVEILSQQFPRHQAVVINASFSFKPGQRYIQYPDHKMSLGSRYPLFSLEYTKGIHGLFGSDVDYDKWNFRISDDANFKMAGSLKYRLSVGGFLNSNKVFAQDYKHYFANNSKIAQEYMVSFQNRTPYSLSNISPIYVELHLEHHANGLITNKIPLLRKWNWHLVEGTNTMITSGKAHYAEVFVGLENIFKIFRIDMVAGFQNGLQPVYMYRVGFGGMLGDPINVFRFMRHKKIIDRW